MEVNLHLIPTEQVVNVTVLFDTNVPCSVGGTQTN